LKRTLRKRLSKKLSKTRRTFSKLFKRKKIDIYSQNVHLGKFLKFLRNLSRISRAQEIRQESPVSPSEERSATTELDMEYNPPPPDEDIKKKIEYEYKPYEEEKIYKNLYEEES
jgi:hypothetical protein